MYESASQGFNTDQPFMNNVQFKYQSYVSCIGNLILRLVNNWLLIHSDSCVDSHLHFCWRILHQSPSQSSLCIKNSAVLNQDLKLHQLQHLNTSYCQAEGMFTCVQHYFSVCWFKAYRMPRKHIFASSTQFLVTIDV